MQLSPGRRVIRGSISFVALALALSLPTTALAAPPSAELMARLADYAARYKTMQSQMSCAIDGRMEELAGDGKTDTLKETQGRIEPDGARGRLVVSRYVENGRDKTQDEQKRLASNGASPKEKKSLRIPIAAAEQANYVFDQVEVDPRDASRVRITFVPKAPNETTIEGSAWIDARSGTVISAAFKLSRPSTFVDYVHVVVEFGAQTPYGPAASRIRVEGKGGVLFIRKHFRGSATLSDYRPKAS